VIHRKASQRARRHAEKFGGTWSMVAREWEFQRRGVLHMHVVVPMATALERECSHLYNQALEELAPAAGFGWIDRGKHQGRKRRELVAVPQGQAARYLAKYIASVDGSKLRLSETVLHPDVPPHVTYVARSLTTATGCTMRSLRKRREDYCYGRDLVRQLDKHEEGWVSFLMSQDDLPDDVRAAIQMALGP
jgi:hypothetical protein